MNETKVTGIIMDGTQCCSQKGSKIRYYINEEKRTVVAVLDNVETEVIEEVKPFFPMTISWSEMSKFALKPIYRGKAVCHEDDEWDVEVGKRIARNRMLTNFYADRFNALWKFNDYLDDIKRKISKKILTADNCVTAALEEKR